jgi:hypothetical protein
MNICKLNNKQLIELLGIKSYYICKLMISYSKNGLDWEDSESFIITAREAKQIINRLKGKGIDCAPYEYLMQFDTRPDLKF